MDCIDCHSRPTHQFRAPYRLLNDAMQFGQLDKTVPGLKEQGMEVLSKKYATGEEAEAGIERTLKEYYATKQAEYLKAHPESVENAIRTVKQLYRDNMFPEMKTRWDTHPDNIGHLISPGCFRCHDGEHRSVEGVTISRDCKACHLIVEQGPAGKTEKNIEGLEFKHPVDIGEDWKESSCNDCHSGGA